MGKPCRVTFGDRVFFKPDFIKRFLDTLHLEDNVVEESKYLKSIGYDNAFNEGDPMLIREKKAEAKAEAEVVNSNADYDRINKELIKKRGDAFNKRNKLKQGTSEYNLAQKEVEKADNDLINFQSKNTDLILEHGTPHDFNKFELEKIGTGEGNQAFGYGLYFTENSRIAKSYAEKLSKDKEGIIYQVRIKDGRNKEWIEWRDALDDTQVERIANAVKGKKEEYDKYLSETENNETHTGVAEQIFNENISVDERPLQAGAVYADLRDAFGSQDATKIMQEAGIDGVKYKTRGGKGDDFNYVVFNPESIVIENKKNLPTQEAKAPTSIFDDFDSTNKGKSIKSKAEANKAFKEKYGEDAAVAKAISSNFEAIADELKAKGIFTKIKC